MQRFQVETCEGVVLYTQCIDLEGDAAKKKLQEIHRCIYGDTGDLQITTFIEKQNSVVAIATETH